MNRKYSTAIVAIFRDEVPYILEWIAFHLNMGIDFFYIADNESNDGTTELLEALDQLNIIKHIRFPTPSNSPPQLPAYEKIMAEYKEKHDWFAFIDADEFIMPQSNISLDCMLSTISENPEIGAIGLNWAVYGSSNLRKYDARLVLERFILRGEKTITLNKHFKSLIRSSAYDKTAGNPHFFKLKDGFHYAHTDGNKISNLVQNVDGLSKGVCWEAFRLNHYVIKSYEEFINKKNRGRATKKEGSQENRNESFFLEHDVNDVKDVVSTSILNATKEKLEELKHRITELKGDSLIKSIQFRLNDKLYGCYDSITLNDQNLIIRGWAFSSMHSELSFHVTCNDLSAELCSVELLKRPDVKGVYNNAPEICGFLIECKLPEKILDHQKGEIKIFTSANGKTLLLKN